MQVKRAAVAREISHQHLAAPDGPVGAVAGAVEGHADDRLLPHVASFRHAGGDVGVVMLDADSRQAIGSCSIEGVAAGQVVWMQVVGEHLGAGAEK